MKIPERLFSTKNLKFSKNKLKQLIDDLSAVDMKLADPVKRPMFSGLLGESSAFKRKRADTIKALIAKKCMIINTYTLPSEAEELLAYTNLAFSCYQSADNEHVKNAWKGKMMLAVKKLRTLIMANEADSIADEFLFLSEEMNKALEGEGKKKRLF